MSVRSTMGRGLAAGIALVLFAIALAVLTLTGGGERLAAAATVAGLLSLSLAILAHVTDPAAR